MPCLLSCAKAVENLWTPVEKKVLDMHVMIDYLLHRPQTIAESKIKRRF